MQKSHLKKHEEHSLVCAKIFETEFFRFLEDFQFIQHRSTAGRKKKTHRRELF